MKLISPVFFVMAFMALYSCNLRQQVHVKEQQDWKEFVNQQLPLLGHRNWILIVDKAFPAQAADGIITINTSEELLPVLSYTLQKIDGASHVKPILYIDKELNFITSKQVHVINSFRDSLAIVTEEYEMQTLLHDSVFVKIDQASELFKILVLKTEMTIPYSSVFIELDCRYWSGEKEKDLRKAIFNNTN